MKLAKLSFLLIFIVFSNASQSQWNKVNSNTTHEIFDVEFVNESVGYYSGIDGFFKSTDTGNTWFNLPYLAPNENFEWDNYYDIHFLNPDTGFMVGYSFYTGTGNIIKTTDGGIHWKTVYDSRQQIDMRSIAFHSDNLTGIAVGDLGTIVRTTDGGETWVRKNSNTVKYLMSVTSNFSTDPEFLIVGAGVALKGDLNMVLIPTMNYNLTKVQTYGLDKFIAAGNDGLVIHSEDFGSTWTESYTRLKTNIAAAHFFSKDTGYVCTFNELLYTTSGGKYWAKQSIPKGYNIHFYNKNLGFIPSSIYGDLYKTTSGGGISRPYASFNIEHYYLCTGQQIDFINYGNPAYKYEWLLDGVHYSSAYDTIYFSDPADRNTEINISLVLIDTANNYSDTLTISKTVLSGLANGFKVSYSTDTLCKSAKVKFYISNTTKSARYYLRLGNSNITNQICLNNGDTIIFEEIVYAGSGTSSPNLKTLNYNVIEVGTNYCGEQQDTISTPITVFLANRTKEAVPLSNNICYGDSATIMILETDTNTIYSIDSYSALGNNDTLFFKTEPIFALSKEFTINIRNVDSICPVYSLIKVPKVFGYEPEVSISFSSEPTNFVGDTFSFINYSKHPKHVWDFGSSSQTPIVEAFSPKVVYNTPGEKIIKLLGYSSEVCKDSIQIKVSVFAHQQNGMYSNEQQCFVGNAKDEAGSLNTLRKEQILDFEVDAQGNYYLGGYYYDYIWADPMYSAFIRKFSPNGTLIWEDIQNFDKYGNKYTSSYLTTIESDTLGNAFFAATYTSKYQMEVGGKSFGFTGSDNSAAYLAKLNSEGKSEWVIYSKPAGSTPKGISDILYVDDDHIYFVLPRTGAEMTFTNGVKVFNGYNINIIQINTKGEYIKRYVMTTSDNDYKELCIGCLGGWYTNRVTLISPKLAFANNKLHVVGKVDEYGLTYDGKRLYGKPGFNVYVAKIDTSTGWEKTHILFNRNQGFYKAHTYSRAEFEPIFTLDSIGNIYIAHYSNDANYSLPITRYSLNFSNTVRVEGYKIGIIAKYDSDGKLVWHNTIHNYHIEDLEIQNGTLIAFGQGIKTVGINTPNSYFVADTTNGSNDIFKFGFDSNTGDFKWRDKYYTTSTDNAGLSDKNICGEIFFAYKTDSKTESFTYNNNKLSDIDGAQYVLEHFAVNKCNGPCREPVITSTVTVIDIENSELSVYPVPATTYLQIEGITLTDAAVIHIYDSMGKIILTTNANNNQRIDVSQLNNGFYFIEITENGQSTTRKFIKE